jgi:hypothetical protein
VRMMSSGRSIKQVPLVDRRFDVDGGARISAVMMSGFRSSVDRVKREADIVTGM